ncbi:DAGKc domain-containing protein OS=Streptomyces pilosus OX=28893 GN=GCM10010280_68050 PE=4 SV=1 [Streptomyces pilosus]
MQHGVVRHGGVRHGGDRESGESDAATTAREGGVGWARLALLALLGSILVPLVAAGLRSVLWALVGVAGLALAAVGVWWALAHAGVLRVLGTVLSVAAPVTALALYAASGMLGPALLSLALWALAVTAARTALTPGRTASGPAVVAAPRAPWVLMNPRSGGGKVGRFHLVEKARSAGCRVVLLDTGQDVAALARQAVAEGADLLAVAGGDGTQALVAEVASRHDLPFVVIPAGTRNHFALDLGLDRDDPAAALHALTDGVELRVDLGYAADRVFVNNASFGTYASVVTDPAYRDAKTRTTLRTLPGLLTGEDAPGLRARADGRDVEGLQALLVSNNPYGRAVDAARPGRRQRLDSGRLGVVCVRIGNTVEAARVVRGSRSGSLVRMNAGEVVVEAGADTLPVGIDGEHVVLPSPVVCRSAPGALRVRVPRRRTGTPMRGGAAADWPRVTRLSLGRLFPGRGREGTASREEDGRPVTPGGTHAAGAEGAMSGEDGAEHGEPSSPPSAGASPRGSRHRRPHPLSLPGCWGALFLACLSFTPSLLPRGGLLQGLICGISAAIGYGLGVIAAYVWRAFADREARNASRRAWHILLIGATVLAGVSFGLGQYWQHEIRALMGVTDYSVLTTVACPFVAALVFSLLLLGGRGMRRLYRWTARLLGRWIDRRAARVVGWLSVVAVAWSAFTGLLLGSFVNAANEAFSLRDTQTPEGVHQPTSALRSGGPGSVVPWDSLGREGRVFTGSGPSARDIGAFTRRAAQEPVRAYAGLTTSDDAESRAARAVADLERAGGFERENLLVMTTTGSGWVDPAAVDSFEYLGNGDSATVAMQYSYLPSWLSYLVDQSKARQAGRELFDAVYDTWSKLPQDRRPRLFVAGESLGSFGGETAFSGEYDLRNRTAGTLFAGPPNFNTLFREFSDGRDAGSPEIRPVYKEGRTVRFTDDPSTRMPPTDQPWDGTRVLYLMHPSDPIVWWSPRLALSEPEWIRERPGEDVLEGMVWIPFVTFWQVTADLPFSTNVPDGHGHTYKAAYVDGWNTVMRPAGLTAQDLDLLKDIIRPD